MQIVCRRGRCLPEEVPLVSLFANSKRVSEEQVARMSSLETAADFAFIPGPDETDDEEVCNSSCAR